jgi:protoporphyrinogen oxidase
VIEAEARNGGIGQSYQLGGLTYEFGPHILHAKEDHTIRFYKASGVREVDYYAKMSFDDSLENLVDFPFSLDTAFQVPREMGRKIIGELYHLHKDEIRRENVEEYLKSVLGETLYGHFNRGYSEKFWGRDPKEVPANGAAGWISFRTEDKRLFSEWQCYPNGDFNTFFQWVFRGIDVRRAKVLGLDFEGDRVTGVRTSEGTMMADHFISTIPPASIIPREVAGVDIDLPYVGKVLVALKTEQGPVLQPGVGGIYFPNKWAFNRVCEYPAITDPAYPAICGGSLLGFEYNVFPWKGGYLGDDWYLKDTLEAVKVLSKARVLESRVHYDPMIYPVRDSGPLARYHEFQERMKRYENLTLTGRLGAFRYINMNDCIEMSFDVVAGLAAMTIAQIVKDTGL